MIMHDMLGELADPQQYNQPLDVAGCDTGTLKDQLKSMLTIRKAEQKIADNVEAGNIACPCHLGIGQEAIAVAVSQHLRNSDRIFGAHRSHSHFLAAGGSVFTLFAEVLGRTGGCSKGMGGSMHLFDSNHGFYGAVPIVAGTISITVGAALAAKMDGRADVAVCYFGDGATEEGVFHESLNLAKRLQLPVIFVCENNLFASHLHINLRQPADSLRRFAEAHCIEAEMVDGNDVVQLCDLAGKAVAKVRSGNGPIFIEAITYRWLGHVGPNEDVDVGVKRSDDLAKWKSRDPIKRLSVAMMQAGLIVSEELNRLTQEVDELIEEAWLQAELSPFPRHSALLDLVYYSEELDHGQD